MDARLAVAEAEELAGASCREPLDRAAAWPLVELALAEAPLFAGTVASSSDKSSSSFRASSRASTQSIIRSIVNAFPDEGPGPS